MLDHIKIMQFADGTLDPNERDEVKKQIDSNPEYQKLLNDYISTADTLAELSNEIKSLDLPQNLKNKINNFNQAQVSEVKVEKKSFNFLNLLNIRYSAIAASFMIVFMAGFYANQLIPAAQLTSTSNDLPVAQQLSETGKIKLRGSSSEFITNFYQWFDQEIFTNEVNLKINKLKEGDKLTLVSKDNRDNQINLIVGKFVEGTNNKCRVIYYDKKVSIINSKTSYQISLTVCKEVDSWELKEITLN